MTSLHHISVEHQKLWYVTLRLGRFSGEEWIFSDDFLYKLENNYVKISN